MLRSAAITSSRAMMRLVVASSRPSIIRRPIAPLATIRPLSFDSVAALPRSFSRHYARGSRKGISSEDEDFDDDDEFEGEGDSDAEDFYEDDEDAEDDDEDDEDAEADMK